MKTAWINQFQAGKRWHCWASKTGSNDIISRFKVSCGVGIIFYFYTSYFHSIHVPFHSIHFNYQSILFFHSTSCQSKATVHMHINAWVNPEIKQRDCTISKSCSYLIKEGARCQQQFLWNLSLLPHCKQWLSLHEFVTYQKYLSLSKNVGRGLLYVGWSMWDLPQIKCLHKTSKYSRQHDQ